MPKKISFFRLRARRFFAALFLCFSLAFFGGIARSGPALQTEKVVRVLDGDTFDLESGERIRFIGIDTPEYQPWKNHMQFFGKEARDYSRSLLLGHKVRLEKDAQELDRYGRTLAYVYLEDGRFVNRILVEEGYARAKAFPPDTRYRDVFKAAQIRARQSKKGLWGKA